MKTHTLPGAPGVTVTRLAARLAGRVIVSILKVPKGAKEEMVGEHFRVIFSPTYAKTFPDAKAELLHVAGLYAKAGLPLSGQCSILLGKSAARDSAYHRAQRAIQLNPEHDGISTMIHEIAHWQHDVGPGFGDRDIIDKYRLAMSEKHDTDSKPYDKMVARQAIVRKESKELDKVMATPQCRRGATFTAVVGGVSWDYVVLRRNDKEVTVRKTPTSGGASVEETLRGYDVNPLFVEDWSDAVKKSRDLFEEDNRLVQEINQLYKKLDDTYNGTLSDWLPTEYAKKNEMEWFAELVTTMLLHPTKLTPEVQGWLKAVW